MSERPDRPIFCGNFEYDAEEREIIRLFEKYGRVDRIDMKTGFAFVYMTDRRDGEDAIRKLDDMEFGYKRRRLKVQWAKHSEADRKVDQKPTSTLFVVNFDVGRVRERDLDRFFEHYGRITRIEIRKNYAFVQFDDIKDAIRALEDANGKQLMGRTIAVQYGKPFNNDRDRSRSPRRRDSPPPRRRDSPPPRSRSPSYERGGRRDRSPPPRDRSPPPRDRSPPPRDRDDRSPPPRRAYSRSRSPR